MPGAEQLSSRSHNRTEHAQSAPTSPALLHSIKRKFAPNHSLGYPKDAVVRLELHLGRHELNSIMLCS